MPTRPHRPAAATATLPRVIEPATIPLPRIGHASAPVGGYATGGYPMPGYPSTDPAMFSPPAVYAGTGPVTALAPVAAPQEPAGKRWGRVIKRTVLRVLNGRRRPR